MNFSQDILDKFNQYFYDYGYKIIEKNENYVHLKNEKASLDFSFNDREGAYILWAYRNISGAQKNEINRDVLKNFFGIQEDNFFRALEILFLGHGRFLLEGNIDGYKKLEKYTRDRGDTYFMELQGRQNRERLDDAWRNKNYKLYLELISKLNTKTIDPLYIKKAEFAFRKSIES